MDKNGGSKDDAQDHLGSDGLISELLSKEFINFNPRRDIYNVTFTFPQEVKKELNSYIKHNGKRPLVNKIIEEVEKCRNAEVK